MTEMAQCRTCKKYFWAENHEELGKLEWEHSDKAGHSTFDIRGVIETLVLDSMLSRIARLEEHFAGRKRK